MLMKYWIDFLSTHLDTWATFAHFLYKPRRLTWNKTLIQWLFWNHSLNQSNQMGSSPAPLEHEMKLHFWLLFCLQTIQASPGDNWKSGILQRAGWGWPCSALSALSGSRTSDSLLLWWTVHLHSGWWQNGDTCHDPLWGKKNTKQRRIRNREQQGSSGTSISRLHFASLVGQNVSDGFVSKTDEKTAQIFISQQIFCLPGAKSQTQPIMQTSRQIAFKIIAAVSWKAQAVALFYLLLQNIDL